MRSSVAAAWPAVCRRYEGVTTWMYLDTKGLVTTGIGFLIDSTAAAQALPWQLKTGGPASPAQIAAEWKRVKGQQGWKKYNGLNAVWRDSAVLSLPMPTVDAKLLEMTPRYWAGPAKAIPGLEEAPADAQLAILDEAWQNGTAFLNAGTAWTGTRAAALAGDWAAAASHVPGSGDRAERRKRLFRNAATVVRLGLDRDQLWDATTPTKTTPATPPPVVVPPTPTPHPEVPVVKYAPRHGAALAKYAKSRVNDAYGVGWCQKFTNECGQTGSVGDYDGDKAADAEDGWKKAVAHGQVVKAADVKYDDIPPGVYHYWTGGSSDHGHAAVGVGGRRIVSTDMTDSGPRYGRIGECDITMPRIHWGLTYAGYALAEGNGYTLTDPPANPEDELPTTAEVTTAVIKAMKSDADLLEKIGEAAANADVVPNEFTSNTANEFVATKTALVYLSRQNKALSAKLDELIARFPDEPEPTPAV